MEATWRDEAKVSEYVGRVGRLEARRQGEVELVEYLPGRVRRVLDLGCGDGRLLELVLAARPDVIDAIGVDYSPPMLELASQRFAGDPRVALHERDLAAPLLGFGTFDVIVSGFAIHHLTHERKRTLFGEVAASLDAGGVFVNLEVVQCATSALHDEFNERIGRPGGDQQDILAGVDEQLAWMRDAGLAEVDCAWRWRGFALLIGRTASLVAPTCRTAVVA